MTGETGQDEQIIELTEMVDDAAGVTDTLSDENIIELVDIDSEGELVDIDSEAVDAQIDGTTAQDVWGENTQTEDVLPIAASVSMHQVEIALERVIEKKFAEKIEPMIFDVMERVILEEIQKIKESLQKDLDQIRPS